MLKFAKWIALVAAAATLTGCVVVPRGYWGGHHHGYGDRGGHHGDDGHRGRGRGGDRWR